MVALLFVLLLLVDSFRFSFFVPAVELLVFRQGKLIEVCWLSPIERSLVLLVFVGIITSDYQ